MSRESCSVLYNVILFDKQTHQIHGTNVQSQWIGWYFFYVFPSKVLTRKYGIHPWWGIPVANALYFMLCC